MRYRVHIGRPSNQSILNVWLVQVMDWYCIKSHSLRREWRDYNDKLRISWHGRYDFAVERSSWPSHEYYANLFRRHGDGFIIVPGKCANLTIFQRECNAFLVDVFRVFDRPSLGQWLTVLQECCVPKKLSGDENHALTKRHAACQQELLQSCYTVVNYILSNIIHCRTVLQIYYDAKFQQMNHLYEEIKRIESLHLHSKRREYVTRGTPVRSAWLLQKQFTPRVAFETKLPPFKRHSIQRYNKSPKLLRLSTCVRAKE